MYEFDFVKPATLAEAVAALGHDEAQAMGGGQSLIPVLKQRLSAPATLVSLNGLAELQGVRAANGVVRIGAATTHAVVATEVRSIYPALAHLASMIGDPAVRNRGTIGGSLANNDPSACYPAAVLGSGATVETNIRKIAADDYFQGLYTTALEPGEVITAVHFPIPARAAYRKFNHPASRFALTGAFVSETGGKVRVAVTGASEGGVFRWHAAEAALAASFMPGAVKGLSAAADGMIGDIHGTKAYRAHLVAVMTARAVADAVAGEHAARG